MAEATVIDSLIVTLGLDPADFDAGRKKSTEDLLKWRAGLNETAKDAQAQGKKAGQFFSGIKREALGLFAVVAGSKGLESFTVNTVTNFAAMGRAAKAMGVDVQVLGAFQNMIVRAGGSAEHAQGALRGLAQAMEQWRLTGNTPMLPWLNRIGASANDDPEKIYEKFSKWSEGRDYKQVSLVGQNLGFDDAEIKKAASGVKSVREGMAESYKLGVPDQDKIDKVTKLQAAFLKLRQAITGNAQAMVGDASPALTTIFDFVAEGIEQFPVLTKAVIALGLAIAGLGALKTVGGAFGLLKGLGKAAPVVEEAAVAAEEGAAIAGAPAAVQAVTNGASGAAAARFLLSATPLGVGLYTALAPTAANEGEAANLAKARQAMGLSAVVRPNAHAGTDVDYAVRTLIGEARVGDVRGQMDVAHVIRNRMAKSGKGAADIVTQNGVDPKTGKRVYQFEPWGDPATARKLMDIDVASPVYQKALQSWLDSAKEADPTKGATLFVSPAGQAAKGRKLPVWDDPANMTLNREGHEFFTGAFPGGAKSAALAQAPTTVTNTTNIDQITVQTQATDAQAIARDLPPALRRAGLAAQANTGLN